MKNNYFYLCFLFFIGFLLNAHPGAMDARFNSINQGFNGTRANAFVFSANAIQSDGSFIIGGFFSAYDGIDTNRIVSIKDDAPDVFPSIGLAGTFNGFTDEVMSTDDGTNYTLTDFVISVNGFVKFRQDGSWAINWGSTNFPAGTGVQNGADIPVPSGTYTITFNRLTGAYNFELVSEPFENIGVIGEFNNWFTSVPMLTTDGITYVLPDFYLPAPGGDPGLKFRLNNDWTTNWGGPTFPSGNATQNGANIPVTQGFYTITFNLQTLAYSFVPSRVSIIGTADVDFLTDTQMQTNDNGLNYELLNYELTGGFLKFRLNQDWAVNWGSLDFPIGTGTQNGADIPVTVGTYNIYFNRLTGLYSFESVALQTFYQDLDGDGFGNTLVVLEAIEQPMGYVAVSGDCDDNNIAINPGAVEICYDGIDQNCDGNLMNSCAVITARLRAENCDTNLTTLNQVVRGNRFSQSIPSGVTVTGYRFRVTNLLTNAVRIVERSNYVFQLSYTDFAEYNTPYSVEVAVRLNQQWMDVYGAPCTITTPDVPNTVLAATSCGATLAQMNNIIRAVVVPSALQYDFEVSLIEGAVAVETTNLIKTGESFNLLQLSGISIKFGAQYSVRVKVQVPTASGPQWSTVYGAPCSVFTPLAVEAAIEGCGLETGIAPAAMTTLIYATPVGGATQYKFTMTDGMAYTQTYTTPSRYFKLSNFNALQALTPGGTYSVTVEVQVYGFYYPGKDCNILVPGGAPIVPLTRAVVDTDNAMGEFKAVAYPNPYNNSFALDLKTSSTNPVSIAIYDMTGRLLEINEYNAESLAKQTIGERYPSGVYNVIVTQGENMQTVRVVKK